MLDSERLTCAFYKHHFQVEWCHESIKQRLIWVQLYYEIRDGGLTRRRCGISRSTLRKRVKRYEELGIDGLATRCSGPR